MDDQTLIKKGLEHAKNLRGSVVAQALLALDAHVRRNMIPQAWYEEINRQNRLKAVKLIRYHTKLTRNRDTITHASHLLCTYCAAGNAVQDNTFHDIGGERRRRCGAEPLYRFIRENK